MGKSQKSYASIKGKLMAAVAMLLVASFMVVSSTYAWFTLSTAPEVTGIKTKIGANGSLEMALLYYNHETDGKINDGKLEDFTKTLNDVLKGVTSGVGDSSIVKGSFESNKTWGNIVTLDLAEYGLDKVTLIPAALNGAKVGDGQYTLNTTTPLYTPTYGSDGRVEALTANTLARLYNEGSYVAEGYGVRVLGTASGMAAHEMGYNNARSTINSSFDKAVSYSVAALSEAAKTLGQLAVDKALKNTGATYDIRGLATMIDNLKTANSALATAMKGYLDAQLANQAPSKATDGLTAGQFYAAASAALNKLDEAAIVAAAYEGYNNTVTEGGKTVSISIGGAADLKLIAEQYGRIKAQIEAAETAYKAITKPSEAPSDAANAVVNAIVSIDDMLVEGKTAAEWLALEDGVTQLANAFFANGKLNLSIVKGTSDYGDSIFAKFAIAAGKNLSTSTTIAINYNGMALNANASMKTDIAKTNMYTLTIPEKPAASEDEVKQLSDFFGYGIDLAFRTNAANSNLCLQTVPAGRIYSDGAEATMGHGSNMTFNVDYRAWGLEVGNAAGQYATEEAAYAKAAEKVANLATAIRIVFSTPGTTAGADNVVSFAMIQLPKVEGSEEIDWSSCYNANSKTLTLPIVLCNATVTEATYVTEKGTPKTETTEETPDKTAPAGLAFSNMTAKPETEKGGAQVLMPLTQNAATALSVTVYLDGHVVNNSMVASEGTISMGGSLNLQFSSDADLSAMSYTPLQGGGSSSTETEASN